jgi:hypothetical protein
MLFLLSANRTLDLLASPENDNEASTIINTFAEDSLQPTFDVNIVTHAALHNFRLCNIFSLFDDNLGFRMKPRSTTWFSQFLLE